MEEEGRKRVRVFADGRQLGDPLWDMSYEEDDYRFHDALHLTYAAMLGWSPIARWYLGRQRLSQPRVREVEDSGRAKVLEEAVAALARSAYQRGSVSTHIGTTGKEIKSLKRYIDALLAELLEVA